MLDSEYNKESVINDNDMLIYESRCKPAYAAGSSTIREKHQGIFFFT